MMSKLIVALCACKHSGKDVCANYLVQTAGFTHEKFAGPLKETCMKLFDLNDEQVHGNSKDVMDHRWGQTPRAIMQFVGTEMFQHKLQELLPHLGRNFWSRSLVNRVLRSRADKVVISDMRFQHELDALLELRAHGYRVTAIRIDRPGLMRDDMHPSETEFEAIQPVTVVSNDADIATLLRRISDVV